jgi:hypothetical protein
MAIFFGRVNGENTGLPDPYPGPTGDPYPFEEIEII